MIINGIFVPENVIEYLRKLYILYGMGDIPVYLGFSTSKNYICGTELESFYYGGQNQYSLSLYMRIIFGDDIFRGNKFKFTKEKENL